MSTNNTNLTDVKTSIKVAVYGGNGFVGTRVAECLYEAGASTVALSRTGHRPLHLLDHKWSESVRWCKGDANEPDPTLLKSVDVLVLLVGSPPLPTLSKASYDKQLFMNGTVNVNAIKGAADAGIKKVILLGARIPWPLNTDRFAYAKGKRLAFEAAREFADLSDQHSATVLKPGAIFGKRYLNSGKVIPLDYVMSPLSKVMPWQFVAVESVAARIAQIATSTNSINEFMVIENSDI